MVGILAQGQPASSIETGGKGLGRIRSCLMRSLVGEVGMSLSFVFGHFPIAGGQPQRDSE